MGKKISSFTQREWTLSANDAMTSFSTADSSEAIEYNYLRFDQSRWTGGDEPTPDMTPYEGPPTPATNLKWHELINGESTYSSPFLPPPFFFLLLILSIMPYINPPLSFISFLSEFSFHLNLYSGQIPSPSRPATALTISLNHGGGGNSGYPLFKPRAKRLPDRTNHACHA